MIHKFSVKTMHRWSRGDYRVQVMMAGSDRPVAYCDGTDEDLEELRALAREEGVDLADVQKRTLRTGREIWTLGDPTADRDDPVED